MNDSDEDSSLFGESSDEVGTGSLSASSESVKASLMSLVWTPLDDSEASDTNESENNKDSITEGVHFPERAVAKDMGDEQSFLDYEYCSVLAKFMPSMALRQLLTLSSPLEPYAVERKESVLMMIDVSGFTEMCDRYAKGLKLPGSTRSLKVIARNKLSSAAAVMRLYRMSNAFEVAGYGAEGVKDLLNNFFGSLIELVESHGGDVLRIAGDAVIVVFTSETGTVQGAVAAASACAMKCVSGCFGAMEEGLPLTAHVGAAVGDLVSFCVGSAEYGWQLVTCGEPFNQVSGALHLAGSREVVVTAEMYRILCDAQLSTEPGDEPVQGVECAKGFVQLVALPKRHALKENGVEIEERGVLISKCARSGPLARRALRRYSPPPVGAAAFAEMTGVLSEIQHVSVLFGTVNFHVDGGKTTNKNLEDLQHMFSVLQQALAHHNGIIKELSVDDKGMVLMAGFGLSPSVGQLPAARACLAALQMNRQLQKLEYESYFGITTGPVFCASLGTDTRKEFAFVSDTVNLAARLMCAAKNRTILIEKGQMIDISPANTEQSKFASRARKKHFRIGPLLKFKDTTSTTIWQKSFETPKVSFTKDILICRTTWSQAREAEVLAFSTQKPITVHVKGKSGPVECFAPGCLFGRSPSKVDVTAELKNSEKELQLQEEGIAELELEVGKDEEVTNTTSIFHSPEFRVQKIHSLSRNSPPCLRLTKGVRIPELAQPCNTNETSVDTSPERALPPRRPAVRFPGVPKRRSSLTGPMKGLISSHSDPVVRTIPDMGDDSSILRGFKSTSQLTAASIGSILGSPQSEDSDEESDFRMPTPKGASDGKPQDALNKALFSRRQVNKSAPANFASIQFTPQHSAKRNDLSKKHSAKFDPLKPGFSAGDSFSSFGGSMWSTDLSIKPSSSQSGQFSSLALEFGLETVVSEHESDDEGLDQVHDTSPKVTGQSLTFVLGTDQVPTISKLSFQMLLPLLLGDSLKVEEQVEDIIWVRSGGRTSYVKELVRHLKQHELGYEAQGQWWLKNYDLRAVLEVASSVPNALMTSLSNVMSKLTQLDHLVLKAAVVAGHGASLELLMHLLTDENTPFKMYWDTLRRKQAQAIRRRKSSMGLSISHHRSKSHSRDSSQISMSFENSELDHEIDEVLMLGGFDNFCDETLSHLSPKQMFLRCLEKFNSLGFILLSKTSHEHIIVKDMMFVDAVYSTMPVKQRDLLHLAAARWYVKSYEVEQRGPFLPIIVHHFAQGHMEECATAVLSLVQTIGGPFLFDWIQNKVFSGSILKKRLPTRMSSKKHARYTLRALGVLPAVPWLRGLAKALRGIQIGGLVIQGALKFQALLERSQKRKKEKAAKQIQTFFKTYKDRLFWQRSHSVWNHEKEMLIARNRQNSDALSVTSDALSVTSDALSVLSDDVRDWSVNCPMQTSIPKWIPTSDENRTQSGKISLSPLIISEELESLDMDREPSVLRRYLPPNLSRQNLDAEGFQINSRSPLAVYRPRSRSLSGTTLKPKSLAKKLGILSPKHADLGGAGREPWSPILVLSPSSTPSKPQEW